MDKEKYLGVTRHELKRLKQQAQAAMNQIGDEDFFRTLDPESNSIALIVKHMAGNMRSRWTDFLTSDGEKPNRDRDSEFVLLPTDSRSRLLDRWEAGWKTLSDTLASLGEGDLDKTVTIRGEGHSVLQAIERQHSHYAAHVGQIVLLAKHFAGPKWKPLSIPRGQSKEYLSKATPYLRDRS